MEPGDIERSDFATSRRGYDPAAVDAHLREVAAAVERLQDRVEELSARPETLSQAANERLARILEAAEASAAEIRSEAGEEARSLIEEAQRESETMTEEAERRARDRDSETEMTTTERISRVDRRTAELMRRADELDDEFDRLLERMRGVATASIDTLRQDVQGVRAELDEMPGESVSTRRGSSRGEEEADELEPPIAEEEPTAVVEPSVAAEPLGAESDDLADDETGPLADEEGEPLEGAEDEPLEESEEEPLDEAPRPEADEPLEAEPLGDEVIPEPRGDEELPEPPEDPLYYPEPEPEESAETASSDGPRESDPDLEGARLIALNMALSGASRDETADYLRETFGLEDRALLDDVYDRVQAP